MKTFWEFIYNYKVAMAFLISFASLLTDIRLVLLLAPMYILGIVSIYKHYES